MRKLISRMSGLVRIPLTKWYLRKERHFVYEDLQIRIPSGVFHPGLFPSTKLLLDYIRTTDLKEKRVLDIGTGSGILAIAAAQRGAHVTASDVSHLALSTCMHNARTNNIKVTLFDAYVWDGLPEAKFDLILVNPPYYRKNPSNESEMAWYCGEKMEFFSALFYGLPDYLAPGGTALMTFTQDADLADLEAHARSFGIRFELVEKRGNWPDGDEYLLEVISK